MKLFGREACTFVRSSSLSTLHFFGSQLRHVTLLIMPLLLKTTKRAFKGPHPAASSPPSPIQYLAKFAEPLTLKMQRQLVLKFLLWTCFTFISLRYGMGAKCGSNTPTVRQTQVASGNPPRFLVEVYNNCPMCPIINIHLKCGNFSQGLVNPRLLKVLSYDNCVINGGLPLGPLQKFSFNYSHQMYAMEPSTWFFQCE